MRPTSRRAPESRRSRGRRPAAPAPVDGLGPAGSPWITSALLGAAFFATYLWLAPPVSGDKDASELGLALATGGVVHPTGYPIYTILGHGFVVLLHSLGATFPLAANAWAALGGGVAMFLFHRLALRVLPAGGLTTGDRKSVV